MEKVLQLLTMAKPAVDVETFMNAKDLYWDGIIDSFDILVILDEINNAYGIKIEPSGFSRNDFRTVANIYDLIQRHLGA